MKKLSSISLIIFTMLFCIAFAYRLECAASVGDVWVAFQQDSFMGWPITHLLGIVSLPFFFIGIYSLDKQGGNSL